MKCSQIKGIFISEKMLVSYNVLQMYSVEVITD